MRHPDFDIETTAAYLLKNFERQSKGKVIDRVLIELYPGMVWMDVTREEDILIRERFGELLVDAIIAETNAYYDLYWEE